MLKKEEYRQQLQLLLRELSAGQNTVLACLLASEEFIDLKRFHSAVADRLESLSYTLSVRLENLDKIHRAKINTGISNVDWCDLREANAATINDIIPIERRK
jgi:hypothetical protein